MEVTKLVVNNIDVQLIDKPIGIDSKKISLERDFQYSCIDTKLDIEVKFYCASGKIAIDAEYESKGVEGSGYIEVTDTCGANSKVYKFNLDFKKYNNQGEYTTLGLIDENSIWKQDLNKLVNVQDFSGLPLDFYVRNLPLDYEYYSDKSTMNENLINTREDLIWPPLPTFILDNFYIFPVNNIIKNELEDGSPLLANQILGGENYSYQANDVITSSNGIFATGLFSNRACKIEPEPIFDNIVDDGKIEITTTGDNGLSIDITDTTYAFQYNDMREYVVIGSDFNNPRVVMVCKYQALSTAGVIISPTNTNYTNNFSNGTHTENFHDNYFLINGTDLEVKKGEKVWFYYAFFGGSYPVSSPIIVNGTVYSTGTVLRFINYKKINIIINRTISINFKLTKNVNNSISSISDIEPYHTVTKAYAGAGFLNSVFGTYSNLCNTDCFVDLWFTRGDYLRKKINVADFIVKPSDFFRELEKVVCCGLGYFYDNAGESKRKLMSVYDFYTDNLVPSQYQFDYSDLIDGKITIEPFLSPFYNEIQIGYSNYKDSPKDYFKQNNYSINNIGESQYAKVSDFIASQYVITRALRLGTEDKELEFDKNIFILSGGQSSGYNYTLSQTSGIFADNVITQPLNNVSINRRYATLFNLFRHLYKWGFSLFADKDTLTAAKYEGNTIYDYTIRDTTGTSTNPYYHGLSDCKLPLDNFENVDRTIEDIYTKHIQSGLYVPSQITFKTANLSSLDIIAMREFQYDLFKVTDGTNTYYGNLISANLEDDITEIKLLRRFKNGI